MGEIIISCIRLAEPHFKKILSKDIVPVGAPITGAGMGMVYSFLDKAIPVLTVISLIVGIVLGILSYRLKCRQYKKLLEKHNSEDEHENL